MALYAAILIVVAGGATAYGVFNKTVDLTIDGKTQTVRTFGDSVQDVLDSKQVKVDSEDIVSPAASASISDGVDIQVKYARPLALSVDGVTTEEVVHETTVADALETAGVELKDDAYLSSDRQSKIPRSGLELVVSNPKVIKVKADGDTKKVRTASPTVSGVLEEADVKVDHDDEIKAKSSDDKSSDAKADEKSGKNEAGKSDLSLDKSAEADNADTAKDKPEKTAPKGELAEDDLVTKNMKLKVVRVKTETKDVDIPVAFDVETRKNDDMDKGDKKIVRAGKNGVKRENVTITTADGDVRKRDVHKSKVVREPVNKIVEIGTKAPKPAKPAESAGPAAGVFDRLAQCESGGNWQANTGNGFYGGVQFSAQTWHSMGGSGLPSENSRAEQIKRATALQQQSGWGQWPACSKKLGLR